MARSVQSSSLSRLDDVQVRAVRELLERAAAVDGRTAVNEAGLLHLEHPTAGNRHVLALPADGRPLAAGGRLRGYAQLDDGAVFSTGQLVVDPAERRRHVGLTLLGQLLEQAGTPLRVWAVGNTPAARALAARAGLVAARELLVMTRPLDGLPPARRLPDGFAVRAFVPGRDEQPWLALNARAFADHPEQGAVDADDLAERMAEPWFDPAGFLLAETVPAAGAGLGGVLAGYHWTKRHSAALGEVYVLGVDPGAGGRGLGGALLDLGLQHLRAAGASEVQLYVEGDHEGAVGLYRGRGFTTASRDVMYARP